MASDPFTRWTTFSDEELTIQHLERTLDAIQDDLLVAAACVDRILDDVEVQRALLTRGIQRTEGVVAQCKATTALPLTNEGAHKAEPATTGTVLKHFQEIPQDAQLCAFRATLLERLERVDTYVEICQECPVNDEIDEEWEDDPWAEETSALNGGKLYEAPFSLSTFLSDDLLHSSYRLASLQRFIGLEKLYQRHGTYLWPFRIAIVDSIPEHAPPAEYRSFLPSFDPSLDRETDPIFDFWRRESGWTETTEARNILGLRNTSPPNHPQATYHTDCLSSDNLSRWYIARAETILESTGFVDNALALIQHGAAQGIPGLDELGEELSLLSRLIYDAPQNPDVPEDWTLNRWRSMDASTVVRAYLAHSNPGSLPEDIRRLVMPYLFVLESRAERTGKPDPALPTRLLYEYVLSSPLEMAVSIFESSKPTLPLARRLIQDDEDMVRLALACLYGNRSLDNWPTMSQIFECLPAWNMTQNDDNDDVVDTTILSLGAFVAPSTSRPQCTPGELLAFFKPLPRNLLSKVLDTLDVHLEAGEIFLRWNVPAPLWWFLQSNNDVAEQRAWVDRMVRRAGSPEDPLNTLEDWEWLLEDMLKLTGTDDASNANAFRLLEPDEVTQQFVMGLLSTGKFDIARNLLESRKFALNVEPEQIEEMCLRCSREFYDNAQSGNYTIGDMKLAYECLDVPRPSERIIKEKEFIEATSRICSFNVTARPGIPLSPLEIRLTKDRLSLISRVLSSNGDAYKHAQVILDLVYKLGFHGDVLAEVKVLAMLADTAFQAEDFTRAFELCERMVDTVLDLRNAESSNLDEAKIAEASEVCWVACFQLGRQPEFNDTLKKFLLLGQSLELCSADRIHEVLTSWWRLEKEDVENREGRLLDDHVPVISRRNTSPGNVAFSLRERLKDFHMPSPPLLSTPDAAMLASRTFRTVAANLAFSVGHQPELSDAGSRSRILKGDVSSQANRVLSKGIGWLIGADE